MGNLYYSIRLFIENYPMEINCNEILNMADKICMQLGCDYERLGYSLLHPDYNEKKIGKMFKAGKGAKEKFLQLEIPMKYYGKEELPASPTIHFEKSHKNAMYLPEFTIDISYPVLDTQYLSIGIDINSDLLNKPLTMEDFDELHNIIEKCGFQINSAFVHYYRGNMKRFNLIGAECGYTTINDWRIIQHQIDFHSDWKDKVMDVFYMNSIKKQEVPDLVIDRLKECVGQESFIEKEQEILFKLPQSLTTYLVNRFIMTRKKIQVKKILEDAELCSKDASVIASILKW